MNKAGNIIKFRKRRKIRQMRKMQLNYTTLVATCPVIASNGKKKKKKKKKKRLDVF
jgi:hypothetical protein